MLNSIIIKIAIAAVIATGIKGCRGNKISYVAFGDSLAVGILTIPQYGYAHYYRDYLAQEKYPQGVALNNLGKLGLTSSKLLHALQNDKTFQKAAKGADIITLNIGGNDLLDSNFDDKKLAAELSTFKENLFLILLRIRELNSKAILLLMDIYNPYPEDHPLYNISKVWVPRFNQIIYSTQSDALYKINGIAQVFKAFKSNEERYTWIDEMNNVHPNAKGYLTIRNELIKVTP